MNLCLMNMQEVMRTRTAKAGMMMKMKTKAVLRLAKKTVDGRTFEEAMKGDIDLILDFARGLRHQIQFRDQRVLNACQREDTSFLQLAKACIDKEKRMNSTRAATVATWVKLG